MMRRNGWPVSLMQVWPVTGESSDSPMPKVFLCGEFADGRRIWPFKGTIDSPEAENALNTFGNYEVESAVPAGYVQYIYMNMERKLPAPLTGEQESLF